MTADRLAVLMPTYRFDVTARHGIQTLADLACDDIDVFIGDNSENPEKWSFLNELAARSAHVHVFCHPRNIGAHENWLFLKQQSDHDLIACAHDDDLFTPDYYIAGRDILRANPACSAANGLFIASAWQDGKRSISMPLSYPQESAVERISAYQYWSTSMFYSVYRRSVVDRLDKYYRERPFWPSYMDQFFSYTLLCSGKYLVDRSRQLLLYNNTHWGSVKAAQNEDRRFFLNAGLPADFIYLSRVCWAADIIHYFNSAYRPEHLTDRQSEDIVARLFATMFLAEFPIHLQEHATEIGALFRHAPERIDTLRQIIYTPCWDACRFLDLFVTILETFNPALAGRYRDFVNASILRASAG